MTGDQEELRAKRTLRSDATPAAGQITAKSQ
jgi:hypothetical protein